MPGLTEIGFRPIAANAARRGRVIRLACGPRFARPDGVIWLPHEAICPIQASTGGGFVASFPHTSGQVVLRPRKRPRGQLVEARVRGTRFGHVLRADALTETTLEYDVSHSGAIEVRDDGIVLGAADGVEFGLFWPDWRRRHKAEFAPSTGRITLDVAAWRDEAIAEFEDTPPPQRRTPFPALDLDPTTVYPVGGWAGWYYMQHYNVGSYAIIRNAASYSYGDLEEGSAYAGFSKTGPSVWVMYRGAQTFDTSAVSNAISCVLHVWGEATGGAVLVDTYVSAPTLTGAATDWSAILNSWATNGIGYLQVQGQEPCWCTRDVFSQWRQDEAFHLAFAEKRDVTNNLPPARITSYVELGWDELSFLEVEIETASGHGARSYHYRRMMEG